jgi:hypothetical protein
VKLDAVVGIDVVPGRLERSPQVAGDRLEGRLDLVGWHPELRHIHVVEADRQLPHGLIATGANLGQDGADGVGRAFLAQVRSGKEGANVAALAPEVDPGEKRFHRAKMVSLCQRTPN